MSDSALVYLQYLAKQVVTGSEYGLKYLRKKGEGSE